MPQKIATCSYCGTRAALVLTGETQHHLSCGSCGAPLSRIRHFKTEEAPKVSSARPSRLTGPKKTKKKKSKGGKIWGEVFDLIDDILD